MLIEMHMILDTSHMSNLATVIDKQLLDAGADHVIIVDVTGNLIMERGNLHMQDISSLAVLSAANFAATAEIAKLIGEEDFTLLFHKGDRRSIHFSRFGREYIIITLFDDNVSLGLIRLKSGRAVQELSSILYRNEGRQQWPS